MIINEISKGITHIEDLSVNEFLHTLRCIHEFEITEKVDGAQILFGIDEGGFYTSREAKGGSRIYNADDYGIVFQSTYMRSAHSLLEQALPQLKAAGLKRGDQVEAEVLYGELPNVVPYSADTNYLIFLRTTEGSVDIGRLKQKLNGQSLSVTLESPYTDNGRTINLREETKNWMFSRAPQIHIDVDGFLYAIQHDVYKLTKFLRQPSGINGQPNYVIEETVLNRKPDWCDSDNWKAIKEAVKERRAEIKKTIQEEMVPVIKNALLDQLVRSRHSEYGPLLEDGGWIEGVVLRHKTSGKMVKIVDKDVFGVIREFAWEVRNRLTEKARSTDGNLSFIGNLQVHMAIALGHPELGTMQAKNYLRKAGTITEERLLNLSSGININSVPVYWLNLLEQKQVELERELDKYESEKANYRISIMNNSRQIGYSSGIDRRTKETFASLFEQISTLKQQVADVKTPEDLIQILVGKQLGDI